MIKVWTLAIITYSMVWAGGVGPMTLIKICHYKNPDASWDYVQLSLNRWQVCPPFIEKKSRYAKPKK